MDGRDGVTRLDFASFSLQSTDEASTFILITLVEEQTGQIVSTYFPAFSVDSLATNAMTFDVTCRIPVL